MGSRDMYWFMDGMNKKSLGFSRVMEYKYADSAKVMYKSEVKRTNFADYSKDAVESDFEGTSYYNRIAGAFSDVVASAGEYINDHCFDKHNDALKTEFYSEHKDIGAKYEAFDIVDDVSEDISMSL